MAKPAPRPRDESAFAEDGEVKPPPKIPRFSVTYKGKALEIRMDDIGPGDDDIARRQAGRTISGVWFSSSTSGIIDMSDLYLFIWTARRKSGEPDLTYAEFCDEHPTYAGFLDVVDMESANLDDGEPDPKV